MPAALPVVHGTLLAAAEGGGEEEEGGEEEGGEEEAVRSTLPAAFALATAASQREGERAGSGVSPFSSSTGGFMLRC